MLLPCSCPASAPLRCAPGLTLACSCSCPAFSPTLLLPPGSSCCLAPPPVLLRPCSSSCPPPALPCSFPYSCSASAYLPTCSYPAPALPTHLTPIPSTKTAKAVRPSPLPPKLLPSCVLFYLNDLHEPFPIYKPELICFLMLC